MLAAIVCAPWYVVTLAHAQSDPLPSWNDGPAKASIVEFVAKVAKHGSPDFVPPAERIAVFDNDGTLWAEQPMYFQLFFALDRVQALAPSIPSGRKRSRSRRCSRTTCIARSPAASTRCWKSSWQRTLV